jgi:alkylation response protein AidB-like acyl-CoA dehydrogenase
MQFDLSDDQKLLVDTVSNFVKKESPVERFRKLRDEDGIGWSRDVMRKMGELGWLAIPFSEEHGGLGGSFVDVALILEQLGGSLVPEPYLASIVLGGMAIAHGGTAEQREKYLAPAIAGEKTLALAYAEDDGRYDLSRINTRADKNKLTGKKRWVLNGHAAEHIVVSARDDKGVGLYVVERDAVKVEVVRTMDGHRAAMITLDGAPGDRLGSDGLPILERVIDGAAAAACAEGLGLMSAALRITRDYISQREQFGVKIGSFQALQHRAVDMFVETELARGTTILAAIRANDPDSKERARGVSIAKVHLATGGKLVAQQSIQLHGGIGITDEADIGLFFKRMHVLNALFGDEEHHLARVAALS